MIVRACFANVALVLYVDTDLGGSVMLRKQLIFLKNWLNKSNRKPLVVRGARQVGKSTLLQLFAEQARKPLAVVNLERHSQLTSAFTSNNPLAILDVLGTLPGVPPI